LILVEFRGLGYFIRRHGRRRTTKRMSSMR
jgi:hypothetical protein